MKIDEVLKAKQFCEKATNGKVEVSTATKNNFKRLLEEIETEFNLINKII